MHLYVNRPVFVRHILGNIKVSIDQSTCITIITDISSSGTSTPTTPTTTATAIIINTPSSNFKIILGSILLEKVVALLALERVTSTNFTHTVVIYSPRAIATINNIATTGTATTSSSTGTTAALISITTKIIAKNVGILEC